MAVARSQHDLQHMDAVLDEIQMLHERISNLEGIINDWRKKAEQAASKVYNAAGKAASAAGKAASAAVKKGSEMVHGSKVAPAPADAPSDSESYVLRRKNDKIQDIINDILDTLPEGFHVDEGYYPDISRWILKLSKTETNDVTELVKILKEKYKGVIITSNYTSLVVLVPFNSQYGNMKSDLTAYSRAVLRQVDARAAVPRQVPNYDW